MAHHHDSPKSHSMFFYPPTLWYTKYVKHVGHQKQSKRTQNWRTHSLPQRPSPRLSKSGCQLSVTGHDPSFNYPLRVNNQSQSSFYSLLPREIRLEIYRLVLGERCIHIRFGDGMKRPYLCRYPCTLEHDATGEDHSLCWNQYKITSLDNLLPLLRSCSLMWVPLDYRRAA